MFKVLGILPNVIWRQSAQFLFCVFLSDFFMKIFMHNQLYSTVLIVGSNILRLIFLMVVGTRQSRFDGYGWKGKLYRGKYARVLVAAAAHLPTPWLLEPEMPGRETRLLPGRDLHHFGKSATQLNMRYGWILSDPSCTHFHCKFVVRSHKYLVCIGPWTSNPHSSSLQTRTAT